MSDVTNENTTVTAEDTQTEPIQSENATLTPEEIKNPKTEQTELNYENTDINNLKNIAEKKGLDFEEFQREYVANNCQITENLKQKCLQAGIPEEFIGRAGEGIKAQHELEMNQVSEVIGGREILAKTLEWGKSNLTADELSDLRADLSSNPSLTTAQAIVFYLHSKMVSSEGKAPKYLNDTTGGSSLTDIFKSKAEALKAMSDPRYDSSHKDYDEAYAKELEEKLARTKQANGGISFFG